MNPTIELAALGPLIVLGLGTVLAMLLAPREAALARWAALVSLVLAALLAAGRFEAPPGAATGLLAEDPLARFGVVFVTLACFASLMFGRFATPPREAPALVVLIAFGGAVLCGARHATMLFLGLEVMSLSLVALFVYPLTHRTLEAGYKYFVMSGAGAAALLLGMAMLYADTGALAFAGWSSTQGLSAFGTGLLLVGIGFKFSLAPFHTWTPDAFDGTEPPAASLAGVASKIAVAVVLARLAGEAFGDSDGWRTGLSLLAGASIVVGNLFALRQTSLARMLGYSTVAHSGYIAAILAVPSPLAREAALFYVVSYAPALIAALCLLAVLGRDTRLTDLVGLLRRWPLGGGILAFALLSLSGLPPAAGFIGKLYLFSALADAGAWALLAVAAIGSGLGVYYYARFYAAPFQGLRSDDAAGAGGPAGTRDAAALATTGGPATAAAGADAASTTAIGPTREHRLLTGLCAGLIAVLGVYPVPLIALVERALG